MAFGTDFVLRLAEVRSRAARLPGPDEIRALEAAALAKPRETITPAEIRALTAEAIAHLHEVAGTLAELAQPRWAGLFGAELSGRRLAH